MKNGKYRSLLLEINRSVPTILKGGVKSIWFFDVANGKLSSHDRNLALDTSSLQSSRAIAFLKYVVRFFILHIIFSKPKKNNYRAYIGYLVDVDDKGLSNHLREEETQGRDIFYWYISSANSLKGIIKERIKNGWVADARILECYCSKLSFLKNTFRAFFVFYSIPKRYRHYLYYLTVLDVLNKIESIRIFKSEGYESVKYLSEQYVWEDILTSLGKGFYSTEAFCHNLTSHEDLKLNNLFCYMTQADKYFIKYSIHQMMLDGLTSNIEVLDVPARSQSLINNSGINGFLIFGHFSSKSNRLAVDIANELAKNYKVFFKPHPSGTYRGLVSSVKIVMGISNLERMVNVCFYPTKMLEYCFSKSASTLVFYNNRVDDTAQFFQKLEIPFATYSDIESGHFLDFIDPDGKRLEGLYAK